MITRFRERENKVSSASHHWRLVVVFQSNITKWKEGAGGGRGVTTFFQEPRASMNLFVIQSVTYSRMYLTLFQPVVLFVPFFVCLSL